MSEFLFIPSESANGERIRVRLNDIPQLFSEGLEEPPAPAASFPWQSLRQRFATVFAAALRDISLSLNLNPVPVRVPSNRRPDPYRPV
jgi:hypothetical protein